MSDVIGSYKKCVASLKRKGLIKCSEGKRPLLFQGLVMLCSLFLIQVPSQRSGQATLHAQRVSWNLWLNLWVTT